MTPRFRVGLLATHPIQDDVPWYRELATHVDLDVFFSHRQSAEGQSDAGFNVEFAWDVPLLDGYRHTFLENVSRHPDVNTFLGCDTPAIRDVIRSRRFDAFIVHGWSTKSYWQAINTCWSTSTPVLVRGDSTLSTPRSRLRRTLKYPLHRWFVPRFDGYLTVGTRARQYLLHYGADESRFFDSPHAVDNERFRREAEQLRPTRDQLRAEFGLPANAVVFVFVGKFIELKRPALFVEAVVRSARLNNRIAGLMVGDGPLRPSVESTARTMSAPMAFAGFLNQGAIARAYAVADAIVVPSAHETWGLVVNEAMASGLPAIVTDEVGCADDLIIPGRTGERFRVDDTAGLSATLNAFADGDDSRAALGRQAQQHIERFSVAAAANGAVRAIEFVSRKTRTSPQSNGSMPPIREATR